MVVGLGLDWWVIMCCGVRNAKFELLFVFFSQESSNDDFIERICGKMKMKSLPWQIWG